MYYVNIQPAPKNEDGTYVYKPSKITGKSLKIENDIFYINGQSFPKSIVTDYGEE